MPPNEMPGGYKPPGGQLPPVAPPVPGISGEQMDAEKLYQNARALVDIEKNISSLIETMRKAGYEFETIQKVINKREKLNLSVGDIQSRSKEFNMSLKDMANMSLPQAAKNIHGLSASFLKLLGPMTSVTTAISVLKDGMDSFAALNKSASIFTTQSGLGMRGGTPAYEDRDKIIGMRHSLNQMGIRGQDADNLFTAAAREFGRELQPEQFDVMSKGAAGFAQQANIPLEKAVEVLSQMAYAGVDLKKFQTAVQGTASGNEQFKSSQEKVAHTMIQLWQSTRFLGRDMDTLRRSAKKYDDQLLRGVVTAQEIAKAEKGVQDIGLGEGMQLMSILRSMGVEVSGVNAKDDAFAQVSAMQANPTAVIDAIKKAAPIMAGKMTGRGADSASIDQALKMMGANLPEGMRQELRFGKMSGKVPEMKDLSESMEPFANAAKANYDASKGFTEGAKSILESAKIFKDIWLNENSRAVRSNNGADYGPRYAPGYIPDNGR